MKIDFFSNSENVKDPSQPTYVQIIIRGHIFYCAETTLFTLMKTRTLDTFMKTDPNMPLDMAGGNNIRK